jgi:Flp pilus assembly protein TadD
MNTSLWITLLAVLLPLAGSAAESRRERREKSPDALPPATTPTAFAPLPPEHELASFWNDPDTVRRLLGSYGFASEIEPRLTPEEQTAYREKVVPALREDSLRAISVVRELAKPTASAVFDYTLGTLCFQTEDLTNAVRHFETAIAKFPDFRRAHQNLGFALMREGRYAEALKPLTRTVALGGGDGRVQGLLGFAYLSQERFVSAEGAYRQALVFDPDNVDYRLGLVKAATGGGNYDYALAVLTELLQQYPERDALWGLQANLFIQKEQPAQAAVNLEILRKLGKANAQQLALLGDIYMTQEARELALSAYLEAVDMEAGKNPDRALRAIDILAGRGAWAEADQLARRVRTAFGSGLDAALELRLLKAESKIALGTGGGEKAIAVLEQILDKNPLDGEALLLAGDYYAKRGDRQKAEFRYDAAAKLAPYEPDALVKRAQLLLQSQSYPQAIEFLRKAQKLKPRDNVQRYLDKVEQVAARARS